MNRYTTEQKLAIVDDFNKRIANGEKKKDVYKQCKVPSSTLTGWLNPKRKLDRPRKVDVVSYSAKDIIKPEKRTYNKSTNTNYNQFVKYTEAILEMAKIMAKL